MPRRRIILANKEIYHIYNKFVADEEILDKAGYRSHVLNLLEYYKKPQKLRYSVFKKLSLEDKKDYLKSLVLLEPYVEIFSYALMPNHYHLLLKQVTDKGIQKFIANFQNSFAKFYNLKNERRGSLFINTFKSKRVENDSLLLHISRYIHLNPATSYLLKPEELENNFTTSFPFYLEDDQSNLINKDLVIKLSGSKENYKKFVLDRADYQKELKRIKSLIIE